MENKKSINLPFIEQGYDVSRQKMAIDHVPFNRRLTSYRIKPRLVTELKLTEPGNAIRTILKEENLCCHLNSKIVQSINVKTIKIESSIFRVRKCVSPEVNTV